MFIRKCYQERDKLIKLLQGPLLIATLLFLVMLIMVRDYLTVAIGLLYINLSMLTFL